jgi:hypothetical protein
MKGYSGFSYPSLYQPDLVLYFWHVFLCSCCVDPEDWYKVLELLKLVVHQDCAHLKSSMSVQIHHSGDAGPELFCHVAGCEFGRY